MAGESLQWHSPSPDLNRFQAAERPYIKQTFHRQGWPEEGFTKPKYPIRYQPSADVNRDVSKYFRKDSASPSADRLQPSPMKKAPSPHPEPMTQLKLDEDRQKPEWLQEKVTSRMENNESPRYGNETSRRDPVIYDRYGELTEQEREKKVREVQIAQADLAEAARRKKDREEERRAEIKKIREMFDNKNSFPFGRPGGGAPLRIRDLQENYQPYGQPGGGAPTNDHRKTKFTEHQLAKPSTPKYNDPLRYDDDSESFLGDDWYKEPRYEPMTERESPSRLLKEHDLKMDRVRQNLDQVRNGYGEERREELLREQEREIDELRTRLRSLEKGKQGTPKDQRISDGVSQQDVALMKLQNDIEQLRDNPQLGRPAGIPTYREELKRDMHPEMRAHSGEGDYYNYYEPPTDRYNNFRNQRDRDFWGTTNRSPLPGNFPSHSPRVPIGKMLYTSSTYHADFDPPRQRLGGPRNLTNPNKGDHEPYFPYGLPGGGAPRLDATGQRATQVQRSMNVLGREAAESARLRRENKKQLLQTIGEQAAYERMKKEAEKQYMKEGSIEFAQHMRGPVMRVGYPRNDNHHHLPHAVSNPYKPAPLSQQRELHDYLESQINERNKKKSLNQIEDNRQANLHFVEMDKRFSHDNYGGGAPKGLNLRKVKLDNAIHNPSENWCYKDVWRW